MTFEVKLGRLKPEGLTPPETINTLALLPRKCHGSVGRGLPFGPPTNVTSVVLRRWQVDYYNRLLKFFQSTSATLSHGAT